MPSRTIKQHNLMNAVAHNPKFANKVEIPQKVGKDFVAADKAKSKVKMQMKVPKPAPMLGKIKM